MTVITSQDVISINETDPYYWYYTKYFYGQHDVVFGYVKRLPVEITITSIVLIMDVLFIINFMVRKKLRSNSTHWIPFSVVVVMFFSILGVEFLNYNNFSQPNLPTLKLSRWTYSMYCVVMNVVLEALQRIIPILLIANAIEKICPIELPISSANITPDSSKYDSPGGSIIESSQESSISEYANSNASDSLTWNIKKLSRELTILLVIFIIFVVGCAFQALLIAYLRKTVTVIKETYQIDYCLFLSFEITSAKSYFDILTLSLLAFISIILIFKAKYNTLTFSLNILITIMKLPWPVLYFVDADIVLRQNLRFWFYYSVITSYGLVPLLWLLFDQFISPIPGQKIKMFLIRAAGKKSDNENSRLLYTENNARISNILPSE